MLMLRRKKSELDKLFTQLKIQKSIICSNSRKKNMGNLDDSSSDDRRGFRLTELLTQGSV